jgi:hypothetical protein
MGEAFTSDISFDHDRIGAAAIYCSDGRYGDQMDDFLHGYLGLPRYDRVAIPGGAASLAHHPRALQDKRALDRQLKFLVESHELTRVVMIAHQDCGFYRHHVHPQKLKKQPLEVLQARDLATAADLLHAYNSQLKLEAYFARRVDGKVRFEPIAVV